MNETGAQTGAGLTKLAKWGVIVGLALAIGACARAPVASVPTAEREQIAASLMRDINVLASDEFGGRLPGTEGEQRTVNFLIERLQDAGLESGTNDPGNPWRAPVRLASSKPSSSSVSFRVGRRNRELSEEGAVAFTSRRLTLVENAEVLFVGRLANTVREEDIAGKVGLMLGEAGVSPARRDTLFEKGAAAVITVLDDEGEIANLRSARDRERFSLANDEETELTAFVASEALGDVIGKKQWEELLKQSEDEGFTPVALRSVATIRAQSDRREFTSFNVIGRLPGRVPGSGAILIMAHWDHLGECGAQDDADRICNGAIDNASGLAVMIELAKRLKQDDPLDRDVYFLATTAEESGLLGVRAFTQAPSMPLESIVAAFNFDTVALAPAGSPVGYIGEGLTQLDPVIVDVMREAKRSLGNQDIAESFIQRQDAWVLLQEGVPAVVLSTAFGSEITLNSYLADHYHQASDDVDVIELGGAIDDLLLHEELVKHLADTARYTPSVP